MKKVLIIVGSVLGALLLAFGGVFAYYSGKADQHNQQVAEAESNSTPTQAVENNDSTNSDDKNEEERINKVKSEAKEAEFMKIYQGEYSSSDVYKITGEVKVYSGTNFGDEVSIEAEDGSYIVAIMLADNANFSDGDTITVYGNFDEEFSSLPTMKGVYFD